MTKGRKRLKIMAALLLAVLLLVLSGANFFRFRVNAEEEDGTALTESECLVAADNWIRINYEDETRVADVVPVMCDDQIHSYCISFEKDGDPNGYVVIDTDRNAVNNITEFSLSGQNLYDILREKIQEETDCEAEGEAIYRTGPYEYALKTDAGNYYTSSSETIGRKEMEVLQEHVQAERTGRETVESEYLSYYEGFFYDSEIPSEGEFYGYNIKGAAGFIPSIMSDFRAEGDYKGNCGPTACTNLLSYYSEIWDYTGLGTSREEIYENVLTVSGWDRQGSSGMTMSEANSAMKKIAKAAGYSYSSDSYWFDLWSDWTRDIENGWPVYTSVRGMKLNTEGAWESVGHAVIAVGYRVYDDAKYLKIYDGWNAANNRFIWFDSDYFTSIEGRKIKITE